MNRPLYSDGCIPTAALEPMCCEVCRIPVISCSVEGDPYMAVRCACAPVSPSFPNSHPSRGDTALRGRA